MALRIESGIMQVGNSKVLVLPKALTDSFEIVGGMKVPIIVGDDGIYVHLKSRVTDSDNERLKKIQKFR